MCPNNMTPVSSTSSLIHTKNLGLTWVLQREYIALLLPTSLVTSVNRSASAPGTLFDHIFQNVDEKRLKNENKKLKISSSCVQISMERSHRSVGRGRSLSYTTLLLTTLIIGAWFSEESMKFYHKRIIL